MTSGDDCGTSGEAGKARWRPGPWLAVALVSLVVVAVNSTSDYLDMRRNGEVFDWWERPDPAAIRARAGVLGPVGSSV